MPGVIAEQAPAKAHKPTKNEQRRAKKKQQKREVRSYPVAMHVSSTLNKYRHPQHQYRNHAW